MIRQDIIELFRVPPGKKIRLRDYNPGWAQTKEMKELGKDDVKARAKAILEKNLEDLPRRRSGCGPTIAMRCWWCCRPWTRRARMAPSNM
jgi:hypothetical protein